MIEVYRREYGKDRLIRTFATLKDMLFSSYYIDERSIKTSFGYPDSLALEYHRLFPEADRVYTDRWNVETIVSDNRHCFVVYEDGKLITPDALVGWYRYYRAQRRVKHWRRSGGRVYGRHRRVRTTQERRWINAWDDEEHMIPVRGNRAEHNLPNAWDDIYSQGQKSWKKQSKRLRQWKPK